MSHHFAYMPIVNCRNDVSIRETVSFLAVEKRLCHARGKRIEAFAVDHEILSFKEYAVLIWNISCPQSSVQAFQCAFRFPSICEPLHFGLQFVTSRISDC